MIARFFSCSKVILSKTKCRQQNLHATAQSSQKFSDCRPRSVNLVSTIKDKKINRALIAYNVSQAAQ